MGDVRNSEPGLLVRDPVSHVLWVHSRGLLLPQGITESWLP